MMGLGVGATLVGATLRLILSENTLLLNGRRLDWNTEPTLIDPKPITSIIATIF